LCLILGLFPQPILDSMRWDIKQLDRIGVEARSRIAGVPAPPELDVPTVPALPDVQQPVGPRGGGPKGGGPKGGVFPKGGAKGKAKIGEDE
jgi:NADH-quinone oxidoreductase subunit M